MLLVLSVWLWRCRCRRWWRRHPVCCSFCLYDYDDVGPVADDEEGTQSVASFLYIYDDVGAVADDEEGTQSVASFVCIIMTMLALSPMMKNHPVCCSFCLYDYDDVGAVADDEEPPSLLLVLSVWSWRCWRCRRWWRTTQSVARFVCMIMTMLALSSMMKNHPVCC